jgi:hypothetical protein
MAELFAAMLFTALMVLGYLLIPAIIIAIVIYFYLKSRKKEETLETKMASPPKNNI